MDVRQVIGEKHMDGKLWGGVFMAGLGVYLLRHALASMKTADHSREWPSVRGTIISSEAIRPSATSSRVNFLAQYSYVVGSQRFQNRRVAAYTLSGSEQVQALSKSHAKGKIFDVYYDPENPADALLVTGFKDQTKRLGEPIIAGIAISIGALLIVWAILDPVR